MHVSAVLYFDLETQLSAADVGGWENAEAMRVSVACAYDSAEWHFLSRTQHRRPHSANTQSRPCDWFQREGVRLQGAQPLHRPRL